MAQRIGRYEITGKLGSGGFGVVWRGYDSNVKRAVAIKVLSAHGDATNVSRLGVEATAAGNLNHKNIVIVYDFGEDRGAPFLVMEHLDGIDLRQIIDNQAGEGQLSLLEKVEIMAEAAQGLQYAHANGVLHRDVKPANIMRLKKDGSVKILDFGIARLTGNALTRLSKSGSIPGSIPYMAPELFESGEVDKLCDIWAYGVVFYELLTGIHPFRAGDTAKVIHSILHDEPLPPMGCPAVLQPHIMRLLSKDRSQRTQSLDDLLLDIEPVIRNLSRIEIPALIAHAECLIDADDERAESGIARIQKLDPSNKDIRRLREHLHNRSRLRPTISALLREVEGYADKRDFAAAREKLDAAIELDPNSPTLRNWSERIRESQERAERTAEFISQGCLALKEEDLTGAFGCFSSGLEIDPANGRCSALIEEVKLAMQKRETQAHVRAVMTEANSLILIQAYDEAIRLLADLAETTSSDEQIVRRLEEARQLRHVQEAKDRLDAGMTTARDLLRRSNYEEACQVLEDLEREHPANPAIEALIEHARERWRAENVASEIETLLAQARGQRGGKRFEQALDLIRRALELDRTSSKALALQRTCLDEAQFERDQKRIEAGLQQLQSLLLDEKLEAALDLANRLAADHPREARVGEARSQVEKRIREREELKKRNLRKGIDEAERLLAEGQTDGATRLLGELNAQFPGESTVSDSLDRARQVKLSTEMRSRLDAGLTSVRELLEGAHFEEACATLEELDHLNPGNPAIEVMLSHARERGREQKRLAQVEELLRSSEGHYSDGRFPRALELVGLALEIDPVNNRSLTLKASIIAGQQAAEDREKVARELAHIRELLVDDQLDHADVAIDRLASEYPRDPRILQVKNDVATAIRSREKERRREIRKGIESAERLLEDRQAAAAIRLLRELTERFPDESAIRDLSLRAEQLRQNLEVQDRLNTALHSARELLKTRHFEKACMLLEELNRLNPNNPAGEVLLVHAREQMEADQAAALEREQLAAELERFRKFIEEGDLEHAVQLAEELSGNHPHDSHVAAARSEVAAKIKERDNLRELKDLVVYLQRRVSNGDLDEACQLLVKGKARFPENAELREIESEIQKTQGFDQSFRNARMALQKRAFAEARNIVNALLAARPGNDLAVHLLAEIELQQNEYEQRQAYDDGRKAVERLVRSGKFAAAIKKIEQLTAGFPDDQALQEDLDRIRSARDQQARREAYTRARTEALSLSDPDQSIAEIGRLLQDFPEDPTLMADLESRQAAKLLSEERMRIDARINELDALFRKGEAHAVRSGAKELLKKHNEPRAVAHLEWAEKSIKKTNEIRRKGKTRMPTLRWGALVICCAGLVLVVFLSRPLLFPASKPAPAAPKASHDGGAGTQPPPLKIDLQPVELNFSWQRGTASPAPKTLHIGTGKQDQKWSLSANDPWLLVSTREGSGTKDIGVRVDPLQLGVGRHSTFASLTSEAERQTISVHLQITDPPRSFGPTGDVPKPITLAAPPLPRASDCASYSGPLRGTIRWKGDLKPGDMLTITKDKASQGTLDHELPGCPASIGVDPPEGVLKTDETPSQANRFWRLKLTNSSGTSIPSIQIQWDTTAVH